MDKLIRTQAAGRAALFLDAFSPGDAAVLERLQQLRREVRAAWGQLPEHVRRKAETEVAATRSTTGTTPAASTPLTEDEMAAFVIREFGSLHPVDAPAAAGDGPSPKTGMSPSALQGLLPVGRGELLRLAQIHPPVRERMEALLAVADAKALPEALAQFESALNTVRSNLSLHIADLGTALRVFQEVSRVERRAPRPGGRLRNRPAALAGAAGAPRLDHPVPRDRDDRGCGACRPLDARATRRAARVDRPCARRRGDPGGAPVAARGGSVKRSQPRRVVERARRPAPTSPDRRPRAGGCSPPKSRR